MKWLVTTVWLAMFASMFAWAAFDYYWWTPYTPGSSRELALVLLHMLTVMGGAPAMFFLWTKP